MRKSFATTTLAIIAAAAFTTATAQQKFSRAQLAQDLDSLVSTIEQVHPNPYTVISKDQFYKDVKTVRGELRDSMTALDFSVRAARLVASIGDGHTSLNPMQGFGSRMMETVVFPCALKVGADGTITIARCLADNDSIPDGAVVTAINGRSSKEIVTALLAMISAESPAFKTMILNNYFQLSLSALYGDTTFVTAYRSGGNSATATLQGLPMARLVAKLNAVKAKSGEQRPQQSSGPYSLALLDTVRNVAVIDFNACQLSDQLRPFLDTTFKTLQQQHIGNLIIDVRRNGGGSSRVGDEFFQYISPVPSKQFGNTYMKVSNYAGQHEGAKKGEIVTFSDDKPIALRENPFRYTGKVYLLTSNSTFSSAASFTWAFHYFKMGTIVGEETGGMIDSFGDVCSLKLPNTDLQYGVSFKRFTSYGSDGTQNHGVYPDVAVPADKALDKALELIAAGGKQ